MDESQTYPLLRGRRRHRRRRWARPAWLSRRTLTLLLAGVGAVAVVILAITAIRYLNRPTATDELAKALGYLQRGNYTAARAHATTATRLDPQEARAQAVLARAHLSLGDGVAAEGALNRAVAAGFDARRLPQLFAEAYLLQGDPARAIDTAAQALPRYAAYAGRVRARALAAMGDVPAAKGTLQALLAENPDDAATWRDLAQVRLDAGDIVGADEASARSLSLDRGDPATLLLKAQIVRSRYGLVAALPWFEAALNLDHHDHDALIDYAATLGDAGRYREMLAITRGALAARPGSPPALYLQAVLAARAGNLDLARAMLTRTGGAIDGMPAVLLLRGALDYAGGNFERAVTSWSELLGRQPMNLTTRRLLGAAQLRAGDTAGALSTLAPMVARADADAYTLRLAARGFEIAGQRAQAARLLNRAALAGAAPAAPFGSDASVPTLANAVADNPGDPGVAVAYIRGLIDSGDTARALAQARAIVRASPGAPGAQLLWGDTLASAGQFDAALGAYVRAADLRFDEPTLLRIAETAALARKPQDGAAALALYLSQNPQSVPARRALANLQLAAQEWPAAIDTLEGLRAMLGNRDAVLLAQLAQGYTGAGDPVTGARFGRAAATIAPLMPAASDAWGWALYEQGQTAPAVEVLDKAARLAPANGTIAWHRAQALAEAGDAARAKAAIATALADPRFLDRAAAATLRASLG